MTAILTESSLAPARTASIQHEIDHLNGVLMFDRMTPDQRGEAMAEYRRIQENPQPGVRRRLRLK